MKEQKEIKRNKKIIINKKIIFLFMIEILFLVLFGIKIFKPESHISFSNTQASKKIYHNVNLYGYYEASDEDENIKNLKKIEVSYLTTIMVEDNYSLYFALKDMVDNCPGDGRLCKDPSIINQISFGAMIYNDTIKQAIEKENAELEKYWKCYNSLASNEMVDEKCVYNYYFDRNNSKYKYDLLSPINTDLNILITKSAFE